MVDMGTKTLAEVMADIEELTVELVKTVEAVDRVSDYQIPDYRKKLTEKAVEDARELRILAIAARELSDQAGGPKPAPGPCVGYQVAGFDAEDPT